MLYAVFDNFPALVNPIRQDILRGGPKIDVFVFFLTLEFEFRTIYEVSRPLQRRKPFIVTFIVLRGFKGLFQPQREDQTYCLTSTQGFFAVNIELLHIKNQSYVVCSPPNIYAKLIIV